MGKKKDQKPNWVEISTLLVASLSLIVTTILGGLSFKLDDRIKTLQAQNAEFEARGNLGYRYYVADMKKFCRSEPIDLDQEPSLLNIEPNMMYVNLYDGFIQNKIWDKTINIVVDTCKWCPPFIKEMLSEEEQKIYDKKIHKLDYKLVYLEVWDNSQSFNPRVKIRTKIITSLGNEPIGSLLTNLE